MKHALLVSLLAFTASSAFAGRCLSDRNDESRCEVVVTGSTLSECHVTAPSRYHPDYRGNYPGNYPGTYYPPYHTHPWERVATGTEASACDINLEDCKYFAFRQLEKFKFTNQCGMVSVGKSVEYRFQSFNNDGTMADEVTGRMRK